MLKIPLTFLLALFLTIATQLHAAEAEITRKEARNLEIFLCAVDCPTHIINKINGYFEYLETYKQLCSQLKNDLLRLSKNKQRMDNTFVYAHIESEDRENNIIMVRLYDTTTINNQPAETYIKKQALCHYETALTIQANNSFTAIFEPRAALMQCFAVAE